MTSKPVEQQPAAAIPAFNAERAFGHLLKQTSFGPRNPNSAGHEACRNYFIATLRASADDVRLQEFTENGYNGEKLRLTNIIASFRPQEKDRILLCAHWDTRPRAERDEDPKKRDLPILGAAPGWSGAYLATGAGKKGILLAPAMGRAVAELIVQGETAIPLEGYGPARFAGAAPA